MTGAVRSSGCCATGIDPQVLDCIGRMPPAGIFSALCIKRTNNLADFCAVVDHHNDMQDKTIDNALLALRRQIIRSEGDGLDHVEALLTQRGVRIPRAVQISPLSRGECKRLVLSMLPCTTAQAGRAIMQRVPDV